MTNKMKSKVVCISEGYNPKASTKSITLHLSHSWEGAQSSHLKIVNNTYVS